MDSKRKAYFSGSWYPGSDSEVREQLQKWEMNIDPFEKHIYSGVVPHAGWFFSGKMAYDVIRRFSADLDLLFVLGGHLLEQDPFLYFEEDYCETPCGVLPIHREVLKSLKGRHLFQPDRKPDNTIEVQLPLIRAVLGEIPIVPIRVPPVIMSLDLIDSIVDIISEKKLKAAVLGSTDLTHYGLNYGFIPDESLVDPLQWVKDSDFKILQSMKELDSKSILKQAISDHSACSAGAAACSAAYAQKMNVQKGEILQYDTSYTKHRANTFVGYGSVIYEI